MSDSLKNIALTALLIGGPYTYFVHHQPGPGEWSEEEIIEWLEEAHGFTAVEFHEESPIDMDFMDVEFQHYFGMGNKDGEGRNCSFRLLQSEPARIAISEVDCSTKKNGGVQVRTEFRSTSHYSFAGFNAEGCSNEHLEKLIITFFDEPYESTGNMDSYWKGVKTALEEARTEGGPFEDECGTIFDFIENRHATYGG